MRQARWGEKPWKGDKEQHDAHVVHYRSVEFRKQLERRKRTDSNALEVSRVACECGEVLIDTAEVGDEAQGI